MNWNLTHILRAACAAGALAASLAATPASAASDRALFIALGSSARAPVGWIEFCAEHAPECETKTVEQLPPEDLTGRLGRKATLEPGGTGGKADVAELMEDLAC